MPKDVLLEVQNEMLDYKGLGISVVEMSHRQAEFQTLAQELDQQLRKVMKIPENFKVMYQQGGATQQFAAVPLNLTGHVFGEETSSANFLISG